MITLEGIIKKLGFNPKTDYPKTKENEWLIDDSKENPYKVLSLEELLFLLDSGVLD